MSQRSGKKAPAASSSAPVSPAGEMPGAADSRPPDSESRPGGLSDRWTVVGVCLFLATIIWVVFGQTLGHDFVNYDDNVYVFENVKVMGGLSFKGIAWAFTHFDCNFYHPLTMISLMLDCQFHGLHAGGYHFTNVLLHTLSAILLFLVLRRMTGFLWRSAFVAAVFAIHPLRVESVAWVAERKDVLNVFFFMLTLGAYARYVEKSKVQLRWGASRRPKSTVWYGLTLLFFALGLMSKPMSVTLPFVLLLLDYWPLNRYAPPPHQHGYFAIPKRLILEKIPLLLFSAAACAVAVFAQGKSVAPTSDIAIPLRIDNALVSYAAYLCQMVWPAKLAAFYPYPVNGIPHWEVALSLILLVAISAGCSMWWRRHPYLLVGWLWYLGMLVPAIGIMQVGQFARADRFTYLPQIGLYLALTWAAAELCTGWRHRRVVLGGCVTVILVALILCARAQTAYWRNSESLWTHMLACTSDNCFDQNGLGDALLKKGSVDEAIIHYQKALQINPDDAEAHYNLGNALLQKGSVDEAIVHYQKALQINPGYAEAHGNLGNALIQKGSVDEAITQYQTALQIEPDNFIGHNNLGNTLIQKGSVDEAIIQYQMALQINPAYAKAHYNLGNALFQKGSVDEAIAHFQKALQINPDDAEAHYNLGNALLQKGNVDEAIVHFQRALQIKPDDEKAHGNLGNALLQKGSVDEAIIQYQRALQINPDSVETHINLGDALLQKGNVDEAIAHFQKVLQINPDNFIGHYNLGNAFRQKGRMDEAIVHYQKALQIEPDNTEALNNLAWALATSSQASLRNGNKAVALAQRANQLTGDGNPVVLGTLAAAYAEAGRFGDAMRSAQKAIELARAAGRQDMVEQFNGELKLYEAGLPFHEESK
jgi:tetratricopeptide (TPR) repeat protein